MTANLTIGRFGLDVDVSSAWQWGESGSTATLTGITFGVSSANALVLRQQLMGYAGSPDEEFVPVTWVDQPSVNGFYRITSVKFDPQQDDFDTGVGVYAFSIDFEKVQGFAAPSFESVILGALRVNAAGIVTGTSIPWHGVPAAATGYQMGVLSPTVTTRSSSGGSMSVFSEATNSLYNARPSFSLDPASWYVGAATLQVGGVVAVGRQIANTPLSIVLSNGLIRLTTVVSGTGTGFIFEEWSGSAWVRGVSITGALAGNNLTVGYFNGSTYRAYAAFNSVVVLRNSPEEVVLRFSADGNSSGLAGQHFTITTDVSLRRGSRFVGIVISAPSAQKWGAGFTAWQAASGTALTGGLYVNTNDAGTGNRYVAASEQAVTGTAGGATATVATTRFACGLGVELGGSTATGLDAAQSLIYQYMAATNEKVTVVAR